jgi:hypothetical protein
MSFSAQRMCVWSGPLFAALFFLGFWVLAGFMPPPSPLATAQQTADLFARDRVRIRLGLYVTTAASSLLAPWAAVITEQLKRIEGRYAPLASTQLACGVLLVPLLNLPGMLWLTAAYRSDRDLDGIRTLNDFAWLLFTGVFSTLVIQVAAIGVAVLQDRGGAPLFPRWVGYFNIWVAVGFVPAGFVVFTQVGPFAWNGLLSFWVPIVVVFCWIAVMTRVLLRAIGEQQEAALAAAIR